MDYADNYFYDHDVNVCQVLTNMLRDTFNTNVYYNTDNMTLRVYGVNLDTLRQLVNDLNLNQVVHDVNYDVDYDYNDNLMTDTDCVVLYLHHNLYDVND